MCGPNHLLLREKLGIGGSLLIVWHCAGVRFIMRVCLSLSYPFQCGYFLSHWRVVVTQLVSGFLSEGCSMCSSIFSISVGGGEFRSRPCHHLSPKSNLSPIWTSSSQVISMPEFYRYQTGIQTDFKATHQVACSQWEPAGTALCMQWGTGHYTIPYVFFRISIAS